MSYGSYLVLVKSTYYFRYVLPSFSIGNSKPFQIKKSLELHCAKTARKLTRFLAGQLELFVSTANLGLADMNHEERKRVLFFYLEEKIREWKTVHANGPRLTREQHQERLQEARNNKQSILWDIQSSNLKPSLEKVKALYDKLKINHNADKNDAYALAEIESLFYQYVEMTYSGNIEMATRLVERQRPVENLSTKEYILDNIQNEPLISVLINEFLEEKKKALSIKTIKCYASDLSIFVKSIEDKPINKFTKKDFNIFREELKFLQNETKGKRRKISARRANNIISAISSFFSWCENERDVIDKNIIKGKSLPIPRDSESRQRFSVEDLNLIFSNKRFMCPDKKKLYNYWVPILGYYTGMRLAEICLLTKDDVFKTDDGIWCISLNEKYRSLKNKSSIRDIPLHSDVVNLGFVEFAQKQKDIFIFKTTSKDNRHDDAIGKSFSRFKKSLGFSSNKVFHCFRNTFIDEAFQQGLDSVLYKSYVGHSQSDITHGIYASKANVKLLKDNFLDKMKFPVNLVNVLNK